MASIVDRSASGRRGPKGVVGIKIPYDESRGRKLGKIVSKLPRKNRGTGVIGNQKRAHYAGEFETDSHDFETASGKRA
jgi:hypothetical protein